MEQAESLCSHTPSNILVTGGAGFLAGHLVTFLVEKYAKYKVIVIDKLDFCSSRKNLGGLDCSERLKFIQGDILSDNLLRFVLASEHIDTVIHFAAQTNYNDSVGNRLDFTLNNAVGTHVLLEACREYGSVKRFVNVSTDQVYGGISDSIERQEFTERCCLEPNSPYSAAKAGAEMIAHAYFTSYGLPVMSIRTNNVYGPRQYPSKLIPKFVMLSLDGRPLPVHGDGSLKRSYLYVDDAIDAFDIILHKGTIGEVYNVGTAVERTIGEVAEAICKHFKRDTQASVAHNLERGFNERRYHLDVSKLERLGWRERTPFDVGLKETIEWFSCHDLADYWENGTVELALEDFPVAQERPNKYFNLVTR